MIKITEDKMKSGIIKAVNEFKGDCDFILNNIKIESNLVRINVLDQNKESALAKISTILWLCEYEHEITDLGYTGNSTIHSMYNDVFNEIMYKNK